MPQSLNLDDGMPAHPVLVPKPLSSTQHPFSSRDSDASLQQSSASALSEADIDRFATLFSPATPPATPRLAAMKLAPSIPTHATHRPQNSQSSADSDFGAFVSVPPSQDPLLHDSDCTRPSTPVSYCKPTSNHSLIYFDQFTANAKTAAERSRREVLDELLEHQDDPMYFLNTQPNSIATSPASSPFLPSASPPSSTTNTNTTAIRTGSPAPIPIPIPMPMSTDEALAEALASDIPNPKLLRVERGGSVKVAPSHLRSRLPLPPRLSGSASPPSVSSPTGSTMSLPSCSPPMTSSTSTLASASASGSGSASTWSSGPGSASVSSTHPLPAHATLSRISSSLASLLPSTRPRSHSHSAASSPAPSSAPSTISASTARFHIHTAVPTHTHTLTHGSPFASTPYIPPTGAPGFAGDRAWDRGFSEVLEHEGKEGLVDPIGLGLGTNTGTGTAAHGKHGKGKGVMLVGRWEGTVKVLSEEIADLIRAYLPALTKLPRHWTLLYSLDQHGISLNTLYARCEPRIPSRAHPNPPKGGLLVVRDAQDAVFGMWVSEGIKLEKGGYYGSGESFLWRYHPPTKGGERRLDVYKWTGANDYVALCELGFVSFGGGDGHYGLYLDASLLDGSSAPCPTFGNPPLCSSEGKAMRTKGEVSFECVGLEVWGIGQG